MIGLLGTGSGMTDERAERRATHPLPEELAASTDDAGAQAEAILADSDQREREVSPVERRTSEEAAN